jgi:hypothetical protein
VRWRRSLYPWGPSAPRRHQTWTGCSLDLWLRYKSRQVDLACLTQTCKVNVIRKDGSSRAKGEDAHTSAILRASHRPLDTCSDGEQGRKGLSSLPVRPLPALLAFFAPGNLAAASIPGFRRARYVGRGVVLGAVAVYAWMVVMKGRLARGMRGGGVLEVDGAISSYWRGDACGVCYWFARLVA